MKAKIKDIARIAGVSTGTVDRVIHNRGRVADETKANVLQAMKRLKYKPDILARTLARKEDSTINILLPYPYQDFYWKMVRDGVDEALSEFAPYRLRGKTTFYDMEDACHFNQTATQILAEAPDVVLIGSEFYRETVDLVSECNKRDIPCIVMNAEINSIRSLSYIGVHSFATGTLAGRIIKLTRDRNTILVVHNTENIENTLHLKNKELGMIDALQSSGKEFATHQITISNKENKDHRENDTFKLKSRIDENNIDTIYFTTSRAYQYASAIKAQFPEIYIIGHDLIDQNVAAMQIGEIDLIIDQSGRRMGYKGVKSWVDHHILEKCIPEKQYLPMDIIYPENLPYTELVQK